MALTWKEILAGSPSVAMRFHGGDPTPLKDVTALFKRGKWDAFLKEVLWTNFHAESKGIAPRGHFFVLYQPPGYTYPFAIYIMATNAGSKTKHSLSILRGQNPVLVVTLFDDEGKERPERGILVNGFAVPILNMALYLDERRFADNLGKAVTWDIAGLKYEDVIRNKGLAFTGVMPPAQGLEPLPLTGGPQKPPRRIGAFNAQTVQVQIREGAGKSKMQDVEAYVYKGIAVHQPFKAQPTGKKERAAWVLTHTGSGLALGHVPQTRKNTMEGVKKLADKWGDFSAMSESQVRALGSDFVNDLKKVIWGNASEIAA
ncbi:MAG: hypothetical protein PHC52_00525 [Syntrophales bacterium]|nr:hypothetical protein [Syntrophales bacterium]